jgi:hypothetical protein
MTEVILKKQRPKHLALNQIRLPCRESSRFCIV